MANEGFYKARGKGVPRTDAERVAAHYNISESEARRWLNTHSVEELLPTRGTGLASGRGAGAITSLEGSSGEGEGWKVAIGALVGGAIGAAFGYLLR
jgi:hypothetical protein